MIKIENKKCSNLVKIKGIYIDVATVSNFGGEYQGTITVSEIVTTSGLEGRTIITVVCRGGSYITDGAVLPKHGSDGSKISFSGPVAGTYRLYFDVFYK